MSHETEDDRIQKSRSAMSYAGLTTQLLVLLALAVWGGLRLDKLMHVRALFVIILPLVAVLYSLWQVIRTVNDTRS